MRVLWLCNRAFSAADNTDGGGTWLQPIAAVLDRSGRAELANITHGKVTSITRSEFQGVTQWIVPRKRLRGNGLPASSLVAEIRQAVQDFSPDIIHVWGSEEYWGLLTARQILPFPALLSIQGFKFLVGKIYAADLTLHEKTACIGLKELIRSITVFHLQKKYLRWGKKEKEIIAGHRHIAVQSRWVAAQVSRINPSCTQYHTSRAVQSAFSSAQTWRNKQTYKKQSKIRLFCMAAYSAPFKGLHVATRAVKVLSTKFDNIELRIAGNHRISGIRRDGYLAWLRRECRDLRIEQKINWLGPLKANEVAGELLNCSAFIMPSFIESYSNALAEALMLGVPSVVSYSGGPSELARDEITALFFPPGDYAMCAYQLERILTDEVLADRLSSEARSVQVRKASSVGSLESVTDRLLDIYSSILSTP